MNEPLELLTIGDATIDVFMSPVESDVLCNLDDKTCQICFTYGAKIPVKSMEFSIGGNAANNVIGTKRLGVSSAIVLSVGDDATGKMIQATLAQEAVPTDFVIQQVGSTSNYSTIITYSGERTIFTYHAPRIYEFPQNLPPTPWVYLTSMGEGFRAFYDQVMKWLPANSRLAFNPGSWQLKGGIAGIKDVLGKTAVLFVNREEAEKITGLTESHGKEKEVLAGLASFGVKIPIITDGNNGSFAFDGQKYIKVGVLPIDAYERTGAGDAFGSGTLSALIKGKTLEEALLWGTINSASVIGFVGSQKGLLKLDQLSTWIARAQSSGLKTENF